MSKLAVSNHGAESLAQTGDLVAKGIPILVLLRFPIVSMVTIAEHLVPELSLDRAFLRVLRETVGN